MKIILGILLLISVISCKAAEWSTEEKQLFILNESLIALDWMQTHAIAVNPDKYVELNPLLGRHPSVAKVNTVFISELVLNYFIVDYLTNYRMSYLQIATTYRAFIVLRNDYVGIRVDF